MIFTQRRFLWILLASLCILAFYSACTSCKSVNQDVQAFRDRTLDDFDRLEPAVPSIGLMGNMTFKYIRLPAVLQLA